MLAEEWRDVPGFEGSYKISSHGRVLSLERTIQHRTFPEQVMKMYWHTNNYWVVYLRYPSRLKKKYFVHQLVARVYLPNPDKLPVVNHKDRDRTNCHVLNLEWVTFKENTQHWMKHDKNQAIPKLIKANEEDSFNLADIPFG